MEAKTEILVEKLQSSQATKIFALEKMSFPDSFWNERQIVSHLESQPGIGIFGVQENFAGNLLSYILYLENAWEIEILRIASHREFRRKNYASICLASIIEENPNKSIHLEVDSSNSNAIELYKKHGFQFVDKRKAYYENGNDAYLFVRQGLSP